MEFRYGRESNEHNKRIVKISARKQRDGRKKKRKERNGRREREFGVCGERLRWTFQRPRAAVVIVVVAIFVCELAVDFLWSPLSLELPLLFSLYPVSLV